MGKNIVERRIPVLAHARQEYPERCAHRLYRSPQNRGFVVDDREIGVRNDEPDAEKHEWHHLTRDFVPFTGTDWHFQSWLGRNGKPAQALSSPRDSRTMSRASCVWR